MTYLASQSQASRRAILDLIMLCYLPMKHPLKHRFIGTIFILLLALASWQDMLKVAQSAEPADRPLNILFINVDDMNYDSLGVTGCTLPDISPNIDRLASQGILFKQAHVTTSLCMPSRASWLTGLYPHHFGPNWHKKKFNDVPNIVQRLKDASYRTGIMAKSGHVLQIVPETAFDTIVRTEQLQLGRNPLLYYKHAKQFFEKAEAEAKPFFLMANIQDPHRPLAGKEAEFLKRNKKPDNIHKSKTAESFPAIENPYTAKQVSVPGFLPDLPEVRDQLAAYYTSVRRADQSVGAVLRALKETGNEDNTVVLFMSDHGMPFAFIKGNAYYHSTHTPWIVRWPGVVKPKTVDDKHFLCGTDVGPTILDIAGLEDLKKADGRSIRPLLEGKATSGRDVGYTAYTAGSRLKMRTVYHGDYCFIYNRWVNGERYFPQPPTPEFLAMAKAAKEGDTQLAQRIEYLRFRSSLELYNYRSDPDALKNLAYDPAHQETLAKMQSLMVQQMVKYDDPLLGRFQNHLNPIRQFVPYILGAAVLLPMLVFWLRRRKKIQLQKKTQSD
jgi:N-sulfoglucosamine sulfohydrolase